MGAVPGLTRPLDAVDAFQVGLEVSIPEVGGGGRGAMVGDIVGDAVGVLVVGGTVGIVVGSEVVGELVGEMVRSDSVMSTGWGGAAVWHAQTSPVLGERQLQRFYDQLGAIPRAAKDGPASAK